MEILLNIILIEFQLFILQQLTGFVCQALKEAVDRVLLSCEYGLYYIEFHVILHFGD